nr:NAD-dependent epimerase/dehydratase family protein [Desulfobacterales bacterium]
MKCLVTGVAGFIGSHLAKRLLDEGCVVVGIDNFMDYYSRKIKEANISGLRRKSNFEFLEADLLKVEMMQILEGVDVIFHQSAQAGVRASWRENFKTYSDNNILATQMLLEACIERPIKKFVFASSSSVYGDTDDLPMRESSRPCPVSPYGVSKLAAEHLCYLYFKNFGVPTVSLRYFTVYGPAQRPDMAFHRFFRWALEKKPLQIYGDGEQSRDFTHVHDIVEANWQAFLKAQPGEIFNIGGGSRISMNRVVRIIEEITEQSVEVNYMDVQKGDVRHTSADISKARNLLGYKPSISIEEGLRTELEWIRKTFYYL